LRRDVSWASSISSKDNSAPCLAFRKFSDGQKRRLLRFFRADPGTVAGFGAFLNVKT
jgi:hypothetical protein